MGHCLKELDNIYYLRNFVAGDRAFFVEAMIKFAVWKSQIPCANCKSKRNVNTMMTLNRGDLEYECNVTFVPANGHREQEDNDRCSDLVPATVGTWFEGIPVGFEKQLRFMAWYLHLKPPYANLTKDLRLSEDVASKLKWRVKEVCTHWVNENGCKLGGAEKTVQVALKLFGTRKNKKGRVLKGNIIVAGSEENSDKIFVEHLNFERVIVESKRSKKCDKTRRTKIDEDELVSILEDNIEPGTTVVTSQSTHWKTAMETLQETFVHEVYHVHSGANLIDGSLSKVYRLMKDLKEQMPKYGPKYEKTIKSNLKLFQYKKSLPTKHYIPAFLDTMGKMKLADGDSLDHNDDDEEEAQGEFLLKIFTCTGIFSLRFSFFASFYFFVFSKLEK